MPPLWGGIPGQVMRQGLHQREAGSQIGGLSPPSDTLPVCLPESFCKAAILPMGLPPRASTKNMQCYGEEVSVWVFFDCLAWFEIYMAPQYPYGSNRKVLEALQNDMVLPLT